MAVPPPPERTPPRMRKPFALLALAALTVTLGVAFAATAAAGDAVVRGAATKKVRVGDAYFAPKKISVKKGTIVKWVWGVDGADETYVEHNVRAYKGHRFDSGYKVRGSFKRRIKRTNYLLCDAHRTTLRMKIVVRK